ncbi:MAG: GNAT family N-acetyltransferase [Reichenbachiella sp.]|uniref:GNAT family N-acetyltransferase n=1 Tax=Reichenbachiella sp. TaxID=2184521 RepID=UPI00326753C0
MSEYIIRPANPQDLPTLYSFEQGIISAERPFDPTLRPEPINYYDLKALVASDQCEVLVAEIDGVIVASGYADLRKAQAFHKHDRFAYLGFMYVSPDHRGQGLIGEVLQKLKDWCISRAVTEIRLDVYAENQPALSAYEKAGFKKHMVEMRMEIKKD